MTPGIRDVETFDRMIACSWKFCYYSNFIRKDPSKVPGDIHTRILGELPRENLFASGLMYPFMYLYLQGIRPVVRITYKPDDRGLEWTEAAGKAINFLQLTHQVSNDQLVKIREYYRDALPGGRYRSHSDIYCGMMVRAVDHQKRQKS